MLNRYCRTTAKVALGMALGAVVIFAGQAPVHAATLAAAGHGADSIRTDSGNIGVEYTYYSYPETPAGLAACNAQGPTEVAKYGADFYSCSPGSPIAGEYGLWVKFVLE